MNALNLNQKFNVDMRYREAILSSIAKKIEVHFGRLKPYICEYRDYDPSKAKISEEIQKAKHFAAVDWPGCEKVLLEDLQGATTEEFEQFSSEDEFNDNNKPLRFRPKEVKRKSRSKSPR